VWSGYDEVKSDTSGEMWLFSYGNSSWATLYTNDNPSPANPSMAENIKKELKKTDFNAFICSCGCDHLAYWPVSNGECALVWKRQLLIL
jgi:hypothetical protein